ncbi:Transposon Tf2-8 polyprotein [Vitis vinifera]|uniref:RNA-directed DNA polymerase n=1 Tax=Vitis vinifera TaxID=29760 RepID=A0A438DAG4_VITVI|nr:Transposon Tf2-8 polyprotein [Vitis vinifera]
MEDDHGGEAAEVQEHEPKLEITLHALTGWTHTENHAGNSENGSHEVMVLIDSGSTHNFISNRLANKLRLPVIPTETFPVWVANGERLKCQGRYDKVRVELQVDHGFYLGKSRPKAARSGRANHSAASSEEILKEFRQRHALFAVCFQPTMETAPADAPTKVTQQSMQRLLKEYEDVFQEPSSLPPVREVDHCITLKEGTEPINVRPYRYAHFQKAEIEKQVQEMLDSGLIRRAPVLSHHRPTWDEHMVHVRKTLETLRQHQFFAKASKCVFGQQELEYLGHIVTHQGVKVDNSKIAAMVAWPHPTNISELRGFLGLTGYYRKFVQNYGIIARPLTNLLKKGKFAWNDEAEAAFLALKQAMTTTPTLAMPNFNDSFTIETDASGEGIGAVLSQQGRPIAFMSRALGVTKKSWSTYAKEMLAIVEAIRLWRPYLLGKKFFILTDQRSLKYFLEQRVSTPEQQKWVVKLMGYDYEIIYRPGRENSAADALSRKSGSPALLHLHVPVVTVWDEIKKAYEGDSYVQSLTRMANAQLEGSYAWRNGLLFFKGRVVIPSHAALRTKLLHEMHDTKIGGHSGVLRTFKKLAQQFYWPKMYQAVQEYIKKCETCQKVKSETMPPAGLLQPLPIPCQVWDDITLDFIEGLPTSHGKDTILVVVDRLSKSAHFLALTHPFTAKIVAERFVEGVIKLHGLPKSIISDRDPIFISKFWQEFFQMSGTKLQLSSAYHPQTDGQTEVVNRCVEQYLRSMVHQWPRKWSNYLPWAELWYNTTYHASTGMTPFQALYGRLPPQIPITIMGCLRCMKTFTGAAAVNEEGAVILEPQHILNTRWVKRGNKFEEENLIQWKHLPVEDATWETNQSLLERFPPMDLGDKRPLNGGGIDRPRRSERGHKPNPKYLG